MKAPFPWFGGKSRVAHLVWDRFGDVKNGGPSEVAAPRECGEGRQPATSALRRRGEGRQPATSALRRRGEGRQPATSAPRGRGRRGPDRNAVLRSRRPAEEGFGSLTATGAGS